MENMDIVVLPHQRRVEINPLNPNYVAALAKLGKARGCGFLAGPPSLIARGGGGWWN